MRKVCKTKAGFTLVEMVLVIAIILILAVVILINVAGVIDSAKKATSVLNQHLDDTRNVLGDINSHL